jgi:hypothetical protein
LFSASSRLPAFHFERLAIDSTFMELLVEPADEIAQAYDNAQAQKNARARMEQIDREAKEREQERREGRVHGELTDSLKEAVGRCNPKQLKRLIKLARYEISDHKRPPKLQQISLYFNSKVLVHAVHKNKLYCLEMHFCGKSNCRKCPHGSYVYSYQRNGQFYPRSKSALNFSRLPKSIRERFGPVRAELKAKANRTEQQT